jgi:hypothetical protein
LSKSLSLEGSRGLVGLLQKNALKSLKTIPKEGLKEFELQPKMSAKASKIISALGRH